LVYIHIRIYIKFLSTNNTSNTTCTHHIPIKEKSKRFLENKENPTAISTYTVRLLPTRLR